MKQQVMSAALLPSLSAIHHNEIPIAVLIGVGESEATLNPIPSVRITE